MEYYVHSLRYAILFHTMPYYSMLCHSIPLATIPYYAIGYYSMLCHTIPYYAILFLTMPYYSIHRNTLQFSVKRCMPSIFVMSSHSCDTVLQTNNGHNMRSNFASKNLFVVVFFFLAQKIHQQKQGYDVTVPRITLILLKLDKVTWTKQIKYGISNCATKKSKDKAIFDTHSKK